MNDVDPDRGIVLFTGFAAIVFSAFGLALANLPLHDVPNHAARGFIMADLLFEGGQRFGSLYTLRLLPQPYILSDLVMAVAMQVSPGFGARIVSWLAFTALPLAMWVYARVLGFSRWGQAASMLAAAFVATAITFTLGFLAYQLSLPLLLLAMAAATAALRRPTTPLLALYALCVFCGFLLHLSMPILLVATACTLVGMHWLQHRHEHRFPWLSAAWIVILPLLVIGLDRTLETSSTSPMLWGTLVDKLVGFIGIFGRFDGQFPRGRWLVLLFAMLPLLVVVTRGLRKPTVCALAAIALALLVLFFALPADQGTVLGIDRRAAPLAYLFAAIAGIASVDGRLPADRWRNAATVVLIALTILNFIGLTPLLAIDRTGAEIRQTIAALPQGARVLPIRAPGATGPLMLHSGEFAVLDRNAETPYLFSGDQDLPQKYFRYRDRPYAPSEFWVIRHQNIDWVRTRDAWPYILIIGDRDSVTVPLPVERIAGNRSATLLRFVR